MTGYQLQDTVLCPFHVLCSQLHGAGEMLQLLTFHRRRLMLRKAQQINQSQRWGYIRAKIQIQAVRPHGKLLSNSCSASHLTLSGQCCQIFCIRIRVLENDLEKSRVQVNGSNWRSADFVHKSKLRGYSEKKTTNGHCT